ncbi:interferon-induced protein with tetratricopeptide repeats 1B-like [Notolabrus celidotus]|uniref:interferon-induced protein with tetratricopeptide repeats 1B-like n=1 Tax=Notolabrus celidotus TaxID=1203425 RepID=UPI00148F4DE4|nr:interferon-induced protein with tetratricopeptide repeats 1B-like [Notolabrus celidotus]
MGFKLLSRSGAAQSQTTLESLQCHFTWNLDQNWPRCLRLREKLEDMAAEEGNRWLGHIYNLQGFIQYKLGLNEDAKASFSKAAEAFHELRHADEGPWLLVNYGSLAWLHHNLGDEAESQAYLSKVDALMKNHPSPSQGELHPEVYAEKAWTLIYFGADRKVVADYFEKAIRMQPDMVEWNTSHVLSLVSVQEHSSTGVEDDLLEKMREAKEQDPEDLYLAALYLKQRAKRGEGIEDEAREFAKNNLGSLGRSYKGMRVLLKVYKCHLSVDEAIAMAERVLKIHPHKRGLKRCAALCYSWKLLLSGRDFLEPAMIDRAISLHEEVVSLYPHSPFLKKIDLATVYAKSRPHQAQAKQIYEELLQSDLEPADKQLLYNAYAKYLYFDLQDFNGSVQYHMRAAAIPEKNYFSGNSIRVLEKIREKGKHPMCQDIEEFLQNL